MRTHPIVVTESDERRLRGLLAAQTQESARDQAHLEELGSELERALILQAEEVPAGIITMNSRVRLLDVERHRRGSYTLVFPPEADVAARRISVLAPLGTALLGYREGDDVEWMMPGGMRRLRIERVRQPRNSNSGRGDAKRTLLGPNRRRSDSTKLNERVAWRHAALQTRVMSASA
ncbi:MAG TPA: nucleoside diphosphate kinase regulator [Burkholderiales bacterium]|nr:nucleoside diphosphate kinase regulator [Burkholderiales bacterium]